MSTLMCLTHQGIQIRGHGEDEGTFMALLRLRAEDRPDLAKWLARFFSKQKRQLHFLSHDIQNEVLEDISDEIITNLRSGT